jgi:hypothetical protein
MQDRGERVGVELTGQLGLEFVDRGAHGLDDRQQPCDGQPERCFHALGLTQRGRGEAVQDLASETGVVAAAALVQQVLHPTAGQPGG